MTWRRKHSIVWYAGVCYGTMLCGIWYCMGWCGMLWYSEVLNAIPMIGKGGDTLTPDVKNELSGKIILTSM